MDSGCKESHQHSCKQSLQQETQRYQRSKIPSIQGAQKTSFTHHPTKDPPKRAQKPLLKEHCPQMCFFRPCEGEAVQSCCASCKMSQKEEAGIGVRRASCDTGGVNTAQSKLMGNLAAREGSERRRNMQMNRYNLTSEYAI
jgi:hypothetical protein